MFPDGEIVKSMRCQWTIKATIRVMKAQAPVADKKDIRLCI